MWTVWCYHASTMAFGLINSKGIMAQQEARGFAFKLLYVSVLCLSCVFAFCYLTRQLEGQEEAASQRRQNKTDEPCFVTWVWKIIDGKEMLCKVTGSEVVDIIDDEGSEMLCKVTGSEVG